jgi:exopolysaccharide biosynthesis polyprenyl glycosylphosphotransferase
VRPRRILLLGSGDQLSLYRRQIEQRRPYPFAWAGYVADEIELAAFLEQETVDVVVVAYPHQEASRFEPVLRLLANQLLEVKILPDYGRYSTFTYQAREECGVPLLVVNEPTTGATDRVVKRAIDLLGSFLLLLVLSPVFLVLAILVRVTSKGAAFYSQVRVGADGRVFKIYKFRSMAANAEKSTGAVWAKEGDERVTPLGRFLRKSNFDELPQLWNVFRGEMSLVGPRPERPVFVEQFRKEVPKYMLRHRMKSGMTGWAQVNGWRGNTSLEKRIEYDLYYIEHWSVSLDIKIMWLTVVRGLFSRGEAY